MNLFVIFIFSQNKGKQNYYFDFVPFFVVSVVIDDDSIPSLLLLFCFFVSATHLYLYECTMTTADLFVCFRLENF